MQTSKNIICVNNIEKTNMEKTQIRKITEIFDKEKYTNRKVAEWFIKENTYDNHLLTDIKDVNFNKYNLQDKLNLQPLTDPFCDNIMLFTLTPADNIEKLNKVNMYKKDLCSISNRLLRHIFKKYNIKLAGQSVKCKKAIKYYAETRDKEKEAFNSQTRQALKELHYIKKIEEKYKTIYEKTNLDDAYIITYKVELADENITELHPKLICVLKELGLINNLFFLLDFDITRDYYNSADYQELKQHMQKYFNRLEDDNITYKIIENNKNVGCNCVTYNKYVDNKYVQRGKFYDKFICQVTSGGVTKTVGSNLYNYLFCPDKRLRSTFSDERAINGGITRAEVTIRGGKLPSLEELEDTMEEIYNIGDAPIFYKTPIQAKFRALAETLENNLILYNKPENMLYITLWGNTLTGKTTGTVIKMSKYAGGDNKQRVLNYVKSHYSISLLNCYFVELDIKNEELIVNTTVIKKEHGETQIFKNNVCYTSIPKNNEDVKCVVEEEQKKRKKRKKTHKVKDRKRKTLLILQAF